MKPNPVQLLLGVPIAEHFSASRAGSVPMRDLSGLSSVTQTDC